MVIFSYKIMEYTIMTAIEIIALGGSVATTIGLFVASWQLIVATKQRKDDSRRSAVKEAVIIARVFQEKLVFDMGYIRSVFEKQNIDALVKTVPVDRPLKFTQEEAVSNFGKEALDKFNTLFSGIDIPILERVASSTRSFSIVAHPINQSTTENEKSKTEILERNARGDFFIRYSDVMNTLEWIGMLINTGAADEKVIYQSLNTNVLQFIHLNYYSIAQHNFESSYSDYDYINIVELYNNWIIKKCKQMKEDNKMQRRKESACMRVDKKLECSRKRKMYRPDHL